MAIDSPTNDRLVFNFKSKPIDFNNVGMPRYPQNKSEHLKLWKFCKCLTKETRFP